MRIFDKIHHICIVVHDIDKSRAYYESVGIGPWQEYPPLTEYTDLRVPNRDAFMKIRYQVCNISNLQIQLCQPPQDDCPQRAFLNEKGEGVYHLGFEVPDCDAAEAEGIAAGLPVKMRGRRQNRSGFTYFNTADKAGVTLEIRATPPGAR
ncbi:MAG TPA: VOC family protein [Roseiarcus sp.]|jgi:catechol 2,3-dioxygenase-like lactoylglutathione lyase family enzyme